MGRERHHSGGGESSKRTKATHDPNPQPNYYESDEEEEIGKIPEPQPRGRSGGRRPRKESAQTQLAPHPQPAPREAPYMMRSMSVPRATARPNPRARVILKTNEPPIVPMKYIDWDYFERMNDLAVNSVIAKFEEFNLKDLMDFKYTTFHSTTEGEHYCLDYMTFCRILGLGSEHEKYDPIHVERRIKPHDAIFMFFNPILAREGKSVHLKPFYNYANFMMRCTIDHKKGDYTALNFYAVPTGASRHYGSSSSAPRVDDPPLRAPSYGHSSSRHHGSGSMVKRVLRSIFCMCKTMVKEVNENRRDIIEIKGSLGLPIDPYHELPEFDDPFAEWDTQDAQAAQGEEEENVAPAPAARTSTRRSRRTRCRLNLKLSRTSASVMKLMFDDLLFL
ncbi:actin-like protein ARP8 [Panicum miliaceum]|uniref:Actin-like protein ARP8 n=1 Tax=Panicum miliaceum TaxID=4540 RepID=A0A3L6QS73_PANMI|nr:actin-like protein ARP8 [Panicum miliaceum]